MNGTKGQSPECYIIFDYAWHLTGVKPVWNCCKSFASVKEAGEYLISIFSRDFDEGVFETLLPEEEIDEVKAAVAKLKQDFADNRITNLKVELDLSCFEFKIHALCNWPNGAGKVLETVVEILKRCQEENLEDQDKPAENDLDDDECDSVFKKTQVLLQTKTSELDQEKFDEVFDYMIRSHTSQGAF